MSVRAPTATGPRCFRCWLEMSSGPVDPVDLTESITFWVIVGVNSGSWEVSRRCLW